MLRKLVVAVALATLVVGAVAGAALGAESHAGTIDSIDLSIRSGFVRNEASFKEVGAGSSQVAVWIEIYDGPHGPLKTKLARKSGTSACQAGRTCFTSLQTVVQVEPGECYVGWASTTSDGRTSEQRSPVGRRLCP